MIPAGCVIECPGCRYRSLSAQESRQKKEAWARANLERFGAPIEPLREPSERLGYRRKVLLHARRLGDGWGLGLIKFQGREEIFVPIPHCPLHAASIRDRLLALQPLVPIEWPLAFVLATDRILTLVLKTAANERMRALAKSWEPQLRAAGVASLQINWNPSAGRRVLSSRHQEIVFGERLVREDGPPYGALSFRQQIPELEEEAARIAEAFFAEEGSPIVMDFYSGAGATLAIWEARNWEAWGVELVKEACEAASLAAPKAKVLRGRVEERLPQLPSPSHFCLYTNPPRGGQAEKVNQWILDTQPARIAYLSCNARSLAADLGALSSHYQVKSVQPFDFFPQTDHVEVLALLQKRNGLSQGLA